MATVTVIVTLRRTEGRTPADLDILSEAVALEIADQLEGTEIDAVDMHGDGLTYEITSARVARTVDVDVALATDYEPTACERCGIRLDNNDPHGRPRRYCSDACRQQAYRSRHPTT